MVFDCEKLGRVIFCTFLYFAGFAALHLIVNLVRKEVNKQIFSLCNLGGACSTGCSNLAQVFEV